ncbi:MAG: hypothetical protein ACTSV3_02700 [Candidatus Thorarchaeota archaeon]|nr:MAG: hypothetical protein DRP09_02930 [Candidatus Thorarchaeota archaeon]RLI58407.1 MAG: hypothetical protein DRO87_05740 [Candidatus Thorarchaeota archaeon]
MVSRSLEKMMLIAVGLITVISVGVPVLMFAINTLSATSHLEEAQTAANDIMDAVTLVDNRTLNSTSLEVYIPSDLTIGSEGSTLTMTYTHQGVIPVTWSKTYSHVVVVVAPTQPGTYTVSIEWDSGAILVTFT